MAPLVQPERSSLFRAYLSPSLLFGTATLLGFLAQELDRPISATLVYLLGVLLVGAGWGLRPGVFAAIAASVIYNFFLSEPVLRFSVTSLDELVPLLAFNLTAICSGALAGRLNDRARVAEKASRELNLLLELSNDLQQAINLEEVGETVSRVVDRAGLGTVEAYVCIGTEISPISPTSNCQAVAHAAITHAKWESTGQLQTYPLTSSGRPLGVLVHQPSEQSRAVRLDWGAATALLTIAVERALLFRGAAEREALRKSEEFKTALLSSVSHDLRTPLAAMIASASSLRSFGDQLSAAERQKMLFVIQEQCSRLDRYTSNLLSLAKLEIDPTETTNEVADVAELVGTALTWFRTIYPDHQVSKALETGPVLVRGNAALIEQVFVNVLENAGRYSPVGTTIGVSLFRRTDAAVILIEDEGRGIAPAELERVFERFYRSQRSSDVIGQGLGLSIARGITERFGGRVTAASPARKDRGTRIEIVFPLIRSMA